MPAKKKATKKKASKSTTVQFKCNPACKASPKHPKVRHSDTIVLKAVNTDVIIDFIESPFQSTNTHFSISAGNSVTEVISASAALKAYKYSLACTACLTPLGDPSMIVVA
jgi:hypothetical protein